MKRGMTLAEVVLALGILSLVLVVAVGVLHAVMGERRRQEFQTRAAFLAQQLLDSPETAARGTFPAPFQDYAWTLVPGSPQEPTRVTVSGPAGARSTLSGQRLALRTLYFALHEEGGKSCLASVREDGAGLTRLTAGPVDTQPALSADGRQLAYVSQGRLVTAPAARPDQASVVEGAPPGASEPCFATDGGQLACTAAQDGFAQVLLVSSGSCRNLSRCERHEGSPQWEPRGGRLVVVSEGDDGSQLVLLQAGGSGRRVLTASPGWNAAPCWAPDGQAVAFMSNRDGNPEIYTVEVGSGRITRLTDDPSYDTSPRFSPDGHKLAFCSDRSGRFQLYEMNVDGTGLRRIRRDSRDVERDPAWLPAP